MVRLVRRLHACGPARPRRHRVAGSEGVRGPKSSAPLALWSPGGGASKPRLSLGFSEIRGSANSDGFVGSQERLADRDCAANGVLLDGYPRTRAPPSPHCMPLRPSCMSCQNHLTSLHALLVPRNDPACTFLTLCTPVHPSIVSVSHPSTNARARVHDPGARRRPRRSGQPVSASQRRPQRARDDLRPASWHERGSRRYASKHARLWRDGCA